MNFFPDQFNLFPTQFNFFPIQFSHFPYLNWILLIVLTQQLVLNTEKTVDAYKHVKHQEGDSASQDSERKNVLLG